MAVYSGEGTTVTIDGVALTNVISIKLGAIEQGGIDTFHLGSTSKTQRPDLVDYGSVTLEFYFDDANAPALSLQTKAANKGDVAVVVTSTSGGAATIGGFVTSFELSGMEVGSNLTASCEIKINTYAYAA